MSKANSALFLEDAMLKCTRGTMSRRDFLRYCSLLGISAGVFSGLERSVRQRPVYADSGESEGGDYEYVKVSVTNCFPLRCKGGYLLIDTPYHNKYDLLVEDLAKINIDISEIRYLLLTHHHDDHAGCTAELVKHTGATVILHERTIPYIANRPAPEQPPSKPVNACIVVVLGAYALFHDYDFPAYGPREKDIIVTGDDFGILNQIGVDGKILYTPGHTEDSISVVMSDGRAFVGDVAMNFLNGCRIKHRPIFIRNIDEVYRSWERLKEYGAKTIYPSHGKSFSAEELVPV